MIYALHGFLGKPQDWSYVLNIKDVCTPDIFGNTSGSLWQWARQFNKSVESNIGPHILIGYSLGGRLAIHSLLYQPALWQGVIIISAHPGLSSEMDKEKRLEIDEKWASQFESKSWDALMKDWNNREVFSKDSFKFDRLEKDYSRDSLANALRNWSLSSQEDCRCAIEHLNIPILWIAGANDTLYAEQAEKLQFKHPHSKICIVQNAGHRVPWQQPQRFNEEIEKFLKLME